MVKSSLLVKRRFHSTVLRNPYPFREKPDEKPREKLYEYTELKRCQPQMKTRSTGNNRAEIMVWRSARADASSELESEKAQSL